MPRHFFPGCLALTLTLLASGRAPAQTPDPKAPVLNPVAPLGVQRGTAIDLTLTGSNLAEPTGLLLSFPAKVTIPTEGNNGKDAGKLQVRLEVPGDAPLGFHTLRLATVRGISNLRTFCVDDLPQVMETDTNRSRATPQAVPVPCVVVGKCDVPESADWYKVSAAAGQRISFEVLGRRLGSTFDPQITLYDPRTGRELVGGHSNDAPGLQTDPRLTHTFKTAGDYLLEVRDVSYRAGGDWWYRLRIGDFPCATTPLPLAVKRGSKSQVSFAGPNVDGVAPVEVDAPADPAVSAVWVAPKGKNGLHGWPVNLALSDLDELLEQEPNNEPAKANRIPVPGAITGRFLEKGDLDHYVFTAKKGQRLVIEAHTHDLHSPAEVYMVLRDAKGAQLRAVDPAAAPRLDFTAPADGDYTLAVEHLHYWGGPDESYRLTVTPYEPGFELSVALDRFGVPPGGTVAVPVHIARHDYGGPIDVGVVGEGLSGSLTIAAGQGGDPKQAAGQLVLSAAEGLPLGPRNFVIRGTATINGKSYANYASVRGVVSKEMAGLPVPPRQTWTQLALAVVEKPPFTLAAGFDHLPGTPGEPVPVTVTAKRGPGFTGEIALTATGLPPNVLAALKNIPANANEAKGELKPAPNAATGQFAVTFTGKGKYKGFDYDIPAPPVQLVLADKPPFTLAAKLDAPSATPGKPARLTVTVVRTPGFTGEIALTVAGLPGGFKSEPKTIAADASAAELKLLAGPDVPPGKYPVIVTGKAKHKKKDYVVSTPPVPLVLAK